MGSNIRLVAFFVVLLLGAGFVFKHRIVKAPALPAPVEQAAESATEAVSHAEDLGQRITREMQQAAPSAGERPKARAGGMHKCVGGGSTTYTMEECPPGTKYAEMGGGAVTTMKTNLDGAASSKKSSIPNARELLNDPAEAAKLQELKDKRMEAIIDGRQP
ncbi:hypothetical protein [Aquabacterium sp.]|uniref:hypothetical protein n=1 Tax=Aquabacterium sp. TaxID=1872578 RepID=UPI0035ADED08